MSKEFDEYIADKPDLNLVSNEEVALLKIKLGKSHRKESDWDVIKEIFQKRDVITFTPINRVRGVTNINNILCEDGFLVVFTNIDDCTRYIEEMRHRVRLDRYVRIVTIPFVDVVEIAHQRNKDILIDVDKERNSKCFLYAHESKELKAVILEKI